MSRVARSGWILGLVLAAPLLSACTEDDLAFVTELAKEWAAEHGLLNEAGNPDYLNIGLLLANPASDPQAAAALQAGMVVKGIEDADRLAREGASEGKLDKIEAAIRARPGDWSYQEQKGALLLAQGETSQAAAAFEKSEELVQARVRQGGDCRILARNLLTHRLNALQVQIGRSASPTLQNQLEATQAQLKALGAGESIDLCP